VDPSGLTLVGAQTLYKTPVSTWENHCCESFNGKLWEALLNCELFFTRIEDHVLTGRG